MHLCDRELRRRIDTRECLSVDDDTVNHEPNFDVVGRDMPAGTRYGVALPEDDALGSFNPLGPVCHGSGLFGNGDDAQPAAFRAAHRERAEVRSDVSGFQVIRLAVRTQQDDACCGRRYQHGRRFYGNLRVWSVRTDQRAKKIVKDA